MAEHEWVTVRAGGDPAEASSAERVTHCVACGTERDDDNAHDECADQGDE